MSKSNVHPDHYKVAGRERQGEAIVHARQKVAMSKARERAAADVRSRRRATRKKLSPRAR
jgi:U3 small nucleolar ribonucleoprotein component